MSEPPPYIFRTPKPMPGNLADDLVAIEAPSDGSCFFHSVLNGFFKDYRAGVYQGQKISRGQIVRIFRGELADYLGSETGSGRLVYDELMGGGIRDFAEATGWGSYSLAGMQKSLRSTLSVGYEFHGIVSDVVGKDIYVLALDRKKWALEPYVFDNDEAATPLYKNRPALAVLSEANHFNLAARLLPSGEYQTLFAPTDPLVLNLGERMARLKKKRTIVVPNKTHGRGLQSSQDRSLPRRPREGQPSAGRPDDGHHGEESAGADQQ